MPFVRYTILVAFVALTGVANASTLIVKVSGVENAKGQITAGLYADADSWDTESDPLDDEEVPAVVGQVVLRFNGVHPGTYAIAVMHDENLNDKLDRNFIGIPTEGFGFSNSPGGLRKAAFKEASFDVGDGDMSIEIHLH